MKGGDLGQNIKSMKKNGDKLPEDRIIHWISQLLSACYYIHSKKILHRNIKPA
jgi:serine/threonine protein kinase